MPGFVGPRPVLAVAIALFGCGGSAAGRPGPGSAREGAPTPSYGGHQAELFDDAIEPAAIGYDLNRVTLPPRSSMLLRERAQVGDAVVRARLTTITSKDEEHGQSWQLSFRTLETLTEAGLREGDFTVQVPPSGSSVGMLRAFEGRLVGGTFIVFVREFRRPGSSGESELHFHVARDAQADIAAVRAALTVNLVRRPP
jgi:hypothetical protein